MHTAHHRQRMSLMRPYSPLALSIPVLALFTSAWVLSVSLNDAARYIPMATVVTTTCAVMVVIAFMMWHQSIYSRPAVLTLALLSIGSLSFDTAMMDELSGPAHPLYLLLLVIFSIAFHHRDAVVGLAATSVSYSATLLLKAPNTTMAAYEAGVFVLVAVLLGAHTLLDARIKQFTLHDSLTGVYRRSVFMSSLQEALKQARSSSENVSLLFLDLDNFKAVNDSVGHLGGDHVLRRVGRILRENMRASDYVGRWGGDEFIILVRQLPNPAVSAIAERLRLVIEEHFSVAESITVSIGICSVSGGCEPEALLARADAALYSAKHQGRNMVVVA